MRNVYSVVAHKHQGTLIRHAIEETKKKQLEVNVIYTNPRATAAALKSAASLARDLGAFITLRAVLAVPVRLPLNHPQVSVSFFETLLAKLVRELGECPYQISVQLYLCRNQTEALRQVLEPNSLVVVGGRKRWWPTAESRLVRNLRAAGQRVIFVPVERTPSDASRN